MDELERIRRKYNHDGEWEESKHPRDEGGRFASGGGAATAVAEKPKAPKNNGGSEADFEAFVNDRDPDIFKDMRRKLTFTDKDGVKREYAKNGAARVYGAKPFNIEEMKKATAPYMRKNDFTKKHYENAEIMNRTLELCRKNGAMDIGEMSVTEDYGTVRFMRNGKPCGKVTYDRTMDRIIGNYNKEDGSWVEFNINYLRGKSDWDKKDLPVRKGTSQPLPY